MITLRSKTVFIEYSTANKGQHFMTVVQNLNHERIIIGRIYREYDQEDKKYKYRATDFEGGQIFAGYKDLYAIKKQFVEHGESLAQMIPNPRAYAKQNKPFTISPKTERKDELKNIREKKTEKEKTKEVAKQNPDAKTNPNQKEKEEDSKNTEKYKDTEQGKEKIDSRENMQETAESNSEEQIQEEPEDIQTSEREAELEDIREQNEDREEELER